MERKKKDNVHGRLKRGNEGCDRRRKVQPILTRDVVVEKSERELSSSREIGRRKIDEAWRGDDKRKT